MLFLVFTSHIYDPLKGKVRQVCVLRGPGSAKYFFFQSCWSFPGAMQGRKDAWGSAQCGNTLYHLWTVGTWFRFWVTSWPICHACKWLYDVKPKHAVPAEKTKGEKQMTPASRERRTRHVTRTIEEEGAEASVWVHTVPCAPRSQQRFDRVPASSESEKCIAKTSFKNESKMAVIVTSIWSDEGTNLHNVLFALRR